MSKQLSIKSRAVKSRGYPSTGSLEPIEWTLVHEPAVNIVGFWYIIPRTISATIRPNYE
jgi:hypothetical protein